MNLFRRLAVVALLTPLASAEQKHAELLSATDAAQLKAVFFSGEPWLVQCGTKADISSAIVDDGFGTHTVVEKAVPGLPKELKVGLLDCYRKLPSGKTTVERFKLDSTVSPLLVLAANGKTTQITPSSLTKHGGLGSTLFPTTRNYASALASYVKAKSEPKAYTATSNEHISSLCLKRKHCAILLLDKEPRGETARVVHKLLYDFRTVSFVTARRPAPVLARVRWSTSCGPPRLASRGADQHGEVRVLAGQAPAGAREGRAAAGGAAHDALGRRRQAEDQRGRQGAPRRVRRREAARVPHGTPLWGSNPGLAARQEPRRRLLTRSGPHVGAVARGG